MKVGRNEPCPCGSGKKYKQCCEGKTDPKAARRSQLLLGALMLVVILLVISVVNGLSSTDRANTDPNRVWSPEHGHWHDASGREIP